MRVVLDEVEIDGIPYKVGAVPHPNPFFTAEGGRLLTLTKIKKAKKKKRINWTKDDRWKLERTGR